MIKKETPNPHYLFLDTNILRAKDDGELISTKLAAFLDKYATEFQIFLIVPDVVRDELLYQEGKKAISELNVASASFKKINAITKKSYSYRLTETSIRTSLARNFKKWMDTHHGIVLKAPTDNIELVDIIKRSVWRLPPFDKDPKKGEKGFRDAIIFETIRHHVATCTHSNPIAFICHDKLLRNTTQDELEHHENLFTYESLEDFESYLKLTKQHLEEKFIRTIAKKATNKFFTLGDDTTLYYRDKIRETLHIKYQANFENPVLSDDTEALVDSIFDSNDRKWNQIDGGMFWVYSSQFIESPEDKEYVWKSRIDFTREYIRQRTPNPTRGISDFLPDQRLLKLSFEVVWKARITNAARFMKMELTDISLKEKSFKVATSEDITEYKLDKNRLTSE